VIDTKMVGELNRRVAGAVIRKLEEWTATYKAKNENYGNSWLLTGQILSLAFPQGVVLDTTRKFIVIGMVTRMLDKILRYANLELTAETDKVGEKSSESAFDLGVYGFMSGTAVLDEQTINKLMFTKGEQPPTSYATQMAQATGGDHTAEG
jgi:hypothetical protein